MKQILSYAVILLSFNQSAIALDGCHLGADGRQYCGDVCSLNADGTWSCYNYPSRPDPSPQPVECHLGSNGQQYCGQECALNADGTWSCY